MQITIEQFQRAANISTVLAARWHPHIIATLDDFHINTPRRIAAFIAQVGTESKGFSRLKESFDYSIGGLYSTFPTRISKVQAARLGRQPGESMVPESRQREIANLLYGGRYGNAANEGWLYRGRGLKQVTFHDNYAQCGAALGLDLIRNPDLLLQDEPAARSAGWFWFANGCNQFADTGDFIGLTKRINGGTNGLADRQARLVIAERALCGG